MASFKAGVLPTLGAGQFRLFSITDADGLSPYFVSCLPSVIFPDTLEFLMAYLDWSWSTYLVMFCVEQLSYYRPLPSTYSQTLLPK